MFSLCHKVQLGSGTREISYTTSNWGWRCRAMKFAIHVHLLSRSRMQEALSPPPNTPSWHASFWEILTKSAVGSLAFELRDAVRNLTFDIQDCFRTTGGRKKIRLQVPHSHFPHWLLSLKSTSSVVNTHMTEIILRMIRTSNSVSHYASTAGRRSIELHLKTT